MGVPQDPPSRTGGSVIRDYQDTVRHYSTSQASGPTGRLESAMDEQARSYLADCRLDDVKPSEAGMRDSLEDYGTTVIEDIEEHHNQDAIDDSIEWALASVWSEHEKNSSR